MANLTLPLPNLTSNIVENALIAPKAIKTIEDTTLANRNEINAVLTQLKVSDYERELAMSIVSAESNFQNITGITGDVGVFQFATSTFSEICLGNHFNIKDSTTCALREIKNNQLWRWDASREDRKNYQGWFSRLSEKTQKEVLKNDELCSCVKYASRFIALPPINTPADLKPNSSPMIGAAVLLRYSIGGPHVGIIAGWTKDGFKITESNYFRCRKSTREIMWNDTHIRGFYSP